MACTGDSSPPTRLMDDSEAPTLTIELDGMTEPPVLTKVRIVDSSSINPGSLSAACLTSDPDSRSAGSFVERVGVVGESVTYRLASEPTLRSCDNSPGRRERRLRWCGGAYGVLYNGRLRDPRLDILCETRDGLPIGSVWVQPSAAAQYVSVVEPDYAQVYPVVGGLPIRVTTVSGVRYSESRASFELAEHDADGKLLRRYRLDAAVAG
jgi:hypothetical protein